MFPKTIIQGDTLQFETTNNNFLASQDWSLAYELVGLTSTISISSTASGDSFVVNEAAATTAAYTSGLYSVYEIFSNVDGTRTTNCVSQTTVKANPVGATPVDQRTHAQRTLDAIEAVIEKRATTDQMSYTIGNRSLSRMTPEQLVAFRKTYKDEVLREQGKKFAGRKILPRFSR